MSPLPHVVPSAAELFEGWNQPEWIFETIEAEASLDSDFLKMASVGLAVRLWDPLLGGIMRAFANPAATPPGRARAWLATLSAEQRERFALEAQAALERLSIHIERLQESPDESLCSCFVNLRDRAESVAWILSEMGNGKAFAEQLFMLDESAKNVVLRHLRFEPSEDSTWSHPRWDAAAKEPEAWWAHHVKGFEVY
jgi:hypothetical protein